MNMKRMRGRNHRPGGGGSSPIRHHNGQIPLNRNHVFDSNGPDLRIRGTAQQLFEKYLQLGRDATSSGDRVMAEGYFQHAEHYFRIVNAIAQAAQQSQGIQQNPYINNNQQRGRALDEQESDDRGAEDPLIAGVQPHAGDRRHAEPQGGERAQGEKVQPDPRPPHDQREQPAMPSAPAAEPMAPPMAAESRPVEQPVVSAEPIAADHAHPEPASVEAASERSGPPRPPRERAPRQRRVAVTESAPAAPKDLHPEPELSGS